MCRNTPGAMVATNDDGNRGLQPRMIKTSGEQTRASSQQIEYTPGNWLQRTVLMTKDFLRIEATYQRHLVRKAYYRRPRLFGHVLFKIIDNLNWIPRFIFDAICLVVHITTRFVIQLIDLVVTWSFRNVWNFPYAVTLMFAFIGSLATIPYAYWTIGNLQNAVLAAICYLVWFLWIAQAYIYRPQSWAGWGRCTEAWHVILGPYLPLLLAFLAFAHFELYPVTKALVM